MSRQPQTWTFKEIDQQLGCAKGTAFRAFKRVTPSLQQDQDFFYFSAARQADQIDKMRQSGRIYQTTVNAVLLTESGYQAIRSYLQAL